MAEEKPLQAPRSGTLRVIFLDNSGQETGTWETALYAPTAGAHFADVRKFRTQTGRELFDPGFNSTASCESEITFIDGDKGILMHRGYSIEDLAAHSSFLETCYLLRTGKLPSAQELKDFNDEIIGNMGIPMDVAMQIRHSGPKDKPMDVLAGAIASLAGHLNDENAHLMIGKTATIVAAIIRHRMGRNPIDPDPDLSFAENFLRMCHTRDDGSYTQNPVMAHAMDKLLILHADHEQNASTTALRNDRSGGSSKMESIVAAVTSLAGPLHGGANVEVLEMLTHIGSPDNIPAFIEEVKAKRAKLMGFGHRVYKNYDPRAAVLKEDANQIREILGSRDPRLAIAHELERIARSDQYFIERKLFPNVDFHSGGIYTAMGFNSDVFTMLFATGRIGGWIAHLEEFGHNPSQIARPRQGYVGEHRRDYVPLHLRPGHNSRGIEGVDRSIEVA